MTEDEKYVREHCTWIEVRDQGVGSVTLLQIVSECFNVQTSPKQAWAEAAKAVRTRLEQIRDVGEEIELLHEEFDWCHPENNYTHKASLLYPVFQRILARETETLEALKKGMK